MQPVRRQVFISSPWRHVAGVIVAAHASLPALAWSKDVTPVGNADEPISKAECAEAFEQSQRLRNSFQYIEATTEALRCASPACGAVLAEECSTLYGELQSATPSIVLGARTEDGKELSNVSVSIDGGAGRASLDGTPLRLDPGNHEFRFTVDGFKQLKQTAVILAGERFRPIIGVLTRVDRPARSEAPPPETKTRHDGERRGPPLASYLLGGIGVVGFAGFIGFRIAGANDYATLARDCKPTCTQQSGDAARQKYVLSYVGLAIGGAASIGAVTLYFMSTNEPSQQSATLQLRQLPSGAVGQFTKYF
jgi:hypothetical protein